MAHTTYFPFRLTLPYLVYLASGWVYFAPGLDICCTLYIHLYIYFLHILSHSSSFWTTPPDVSDEDSIAAVRISHIGLALESRFSPALRFSWLLRHLSVLRKTGTWLLQFRPSTPTLYHTIDTHPESGNKRARFTVTNLYCYRVTLIIDWQITHCCKFLYLFATFVIRCICHIPYFHFSG